MKEPLGEIATPLQLLRLDDPVAGARVALGTEAYETEFAAGRAMSADEMVEMLQA